MTGKQHKHHPGVAGGRWKRRAPKTQKIFGPNLHTAHIMVGRVRKKVRLCTKCLRIVKKKLTERVEVINNLETSVPASAL